LRKHIYIQKDTRSFLEINLGGTPLNAFSNSKPPINSLGFKSLFEVVQEENNTAGSTAMNKNIL